MKVTQCAAALALALFVDVSRAHSRTSQGVLSSNSNTVDIQKHMLDSEHQELADSLHQTMDFDGEDMNFLDVSAEVMEGAQILLEMQEQLRQIEDEAEKEVVIKTAFDKIKKFGKDVFEKSLQLVKAKGRQLAEKLKIQAKAGLKAVAQGAKAAGKVMVDALKTQASGVVDLGANILDDLASKGLREGWISGKQRIKTYGKAAIASLGEKAEQAGKDLLSSAKSVFKSQVKEGAELLKKSASELGDDFKDAFGSVNKESEDALQSIADQAEENIELAYEEFKEKTLLLTKAANMATVDVIEAEDEVVKNLQSKNLRGKNIEDAETDVEEETYL